MLGQFSPRFGFAKDERKRLLHDDLKAIFAFFEVGLPAYKRVLSVFTRLNRTLLENTFRKQSASA